MSTSMPPRLYDVIFKASNEDGNEQGLINALGKEAVCKYCFDEAGLYNNYKKEYNKCFKEKDVEIAIACMSIEKGVSYSSADNGPVQNSLYEALACMGSEENQSYRRLIKSKDLMTNFGYVLKILLRVMDEAKEKDIRKLAWIAYGGRTNPPYASFYKEGYEGEHGINKRLERTSDLNKALNEFARNSSTIGNYSYIPTELPDLGLSGLNNMKGGVGASLFVYDEDETAYRVNDQFALFTEWIETYEKIAKEKDKNIIRAWKEMMLLNEANENGKTVWDLYIEAAKRYKVAFQEKRQAERLKAFAEYLKCINDAIKLRSERIFDKIQGVRLSPPPHYPSV